MGLRRRRQAVIVRLLPLLDEAEILTRNLRWYANAEIPTVAFDNGSTDATAQQACEALDSGLLSAFERSEHRLEWPQVGGALLRQAARLEADIVLIAGADEFVEAAGGEPLRRAIEDDLAKGYDVLRFQTMEFCLTDEEDAEEPDPLVRMRRYSAHRAVLRDRGQRFGKGLEWPHPKRLGQSGREGRVAPRSYVSRHYPLRTVEQALARLRAGRLDPVLAGTSVSALAPLIRRADELVLPASKLPRYNEDHRWADVGVVADLRLAAASKLARAVAKRTTKLERLLREDDARRANLRAQLADRQGRLADLRKRYIEVLLERDRLAAAGARPASGSLAALPGWYDEQYRLTLHEYDKHYSESIYLPVWEAIAERIEALDSVIEIGCGSGQLAQLLIDKGLQDYHGFDFSEFAIELARKRLPRLSWDVADARTTALFQQAPYDVALCTEVLEHLDDDVALLTRIRPGARVLATVPNFDSASHLRFFDDEAAVIRRYGSVLDEIEVARVPLTKESAIFVVHGFIPKASGS
jgi:SAM-dependent methyltransferase